MQPAISMDYCGLLCILAFTENHFFAWLHFIFDKTLYLIKKSGARFCVDYLVEQTTRNY